LVPAQGFYVVVVTNSFEGNNVADDNSKQDIFIRGFDDYGNGVGECNDNCEGFGDAAEALAFIVDVSAYCVNEFAV
jgi:hypothetical protein